MLNINLVHTNSNLVVIIDIYDYSVIEEFMVFSQFAFPLVIIGSSSSQIKKTFRLLSTKTTVKYILISPIPEYIIEINWFSRVVW